MGLPATCSKCGEAKFVRMCHLPTSERRPLDVWRFECKKCGHGWVYDENELKRESKPS